MPVKMNFNRRQLLKFIGTKGKYLTPSRDRARMAHGQRERVMDPALSAADVRSGFPVKNAPRETPEVRS